MFKWVRKRFSRRSRGMNLTKQGPDPGPGPLSKKAPPEDFRSNGQGLHPLSYPSEPPDDENMNEIMEESVDVVVYLPDGKSKQVAVNSNIPMMDLLVNLAAGSRLNPAGHTLQVVNEETGKLKEYKANQTIGSLCTRREDHKFHYVTVQIVPKKDSKKYTGNHRNAQPFEMTKRFTVNLPGGQKKVLRISPQSTLEQVLAQLSQERQVDSSRVLFHLPSNPQQKLSPKTCISELPTSEINLVSTSTNVMLDGAKSMPDLSVGRSQSMKNENSTPYMPMAGEGKKKKGFFSFLKKEKKFTVSMQADLNHAGKSRSSSSSRKEGGSPPITRRKAEGTERPKSMYVTSTTEVNGPKSMSVSSSEMDVRTSSGPSIQVKSAPALNSVKEVPVAGPPVKSGKKKRAPPPPSQAKAPPNTNVVTAEITVESKQTTPVQAESRIPEMPPSNQQLAQKFHSRNSSDSSGYHELTLSGAESPDTAKIEENLELKINNKDIATSSDRNKNSMDSGVQDMVSPRRKVRPGIDNLETGSSQTLPLDKVGKKEMSRTRSLERPAGAKKKKAAPPPPGQAPPCEPLSVSVKATIPKPARKSSDSTAIPAATSSPRPTTTQKKDETVAIHAVLDDLDTHLGEDDLENHLDEGEGQEDQMMMVENGDLTVEDVDQPRTPRPCAFVAPPPPDEPPPEDVEIVRYSDIMGIKVDTVDIGTETSDDSTSFDQGSPKSSPNEEEYKNEMAHFVERMNKEVVKQSIPNETEANQKEPDSEPQQKISVQVVKLDLQSSTESSPCPSPRENKTGAEGDQELSEITYSFTVDAVPPEFMENEGVRGQKGDEEEEEEYTETITEVIYPLSSSSDGFGSPRQIPDLDSPKEHVKRLVSNEKSEEAQKVEVPIQNQETAVQVQVTEVEKPREVKHEKEEFVLTFDDLQNVDFTGPKKKKPQSLSLKTESKAPKEEVKRRSGRKSPASVTSPVLVLEELRSRFRSDGDEHVLITPLKESRSNGSIKERCNELSFTPSSEGEQEHVMEEKSISFMAHPVVRSSQPKEVIVVEKLDLSKDVTDGLSQYENKVNNNINEDSVNNNETAPSSARDSSNDNDSAPNSARDSVNNNSTPSSARGSVSSIDMGPVEQMQQQIQVWQQQLEQNQNLLASQPVPTDENSIQLQNQLKAQIDTQKEMLAQMQKSMETLAAQSQTKPQDSPRNSMDGKAEISPPPAPSPPILPQMRMKSDSMDKEKKAKKKSSKKFEPKLDPREELMIQIRGFQGREGLKKVPLKKTKWVSGPGVSQ